MKKVLYIFLFCAFPCFVFAQGTWVQKANFGGTYPNGFFDMVGFSIGNKGYFASGESGGPWNTFFEWNQSTNTWSQKANMPVQRYGCSGFSIGNKGYICCGSDVVSG